MRHGWVLGSSVAAVYCSNSMAFWFFLPAVCLLQLRLCLP